MKRISLYRSLPLFIAVRGMWAAFGRHFTVLQRKKRAERRSENANKPSIHAAFRRSTDCIGHFEAGTKRYYFLLVIQQKYFVKLGIILRRRLENEKHTYHCSDNCDSYLLEIS